MAYHIFGIQADLYIEYRNVQKEMEIIMEDESGTILHPIAECMVNGIAGGERFFICKTPDPTPMDVVMITSKKDIPEELKGSIIFVEKKRDLPAGINSNLRFIKSKEAERMNMRTRKWEKVKLPQILTQAAENRGMYTACDSPMLIRYEKTKQLESGIETWPKTDWTETTYQDLNGGWHDKQNVLEAALIHNKIPSFVNGGSAKSSFIGYEVYPVYENLHVGKSDIAYLNRNKNCNRIPKLSTLIRTEASMDNYSICTADGTPLCGLRKFDKMVQSKLAV